MLYALQVKLPMLLDCIEFLAYIFYFSKKTLFHWYWHVLKLRKITTLLINHVFSAYYLLNNVSVTIQ